MKKISECKREFEIEIPVDEVEKEMESILAQYSSRAKVKGFRPGKAPKDLIKRMYSAEIREDLINSLVPRALNKELEKSGVEPLGSPVISDLTHHEGSSLQFKAQIEVWPEFRLPDYKSIKIEKMKVSVTQKEIAESLEQLQMKSARYVPVENRGVEDGDYVVVEFKGKDLKTKKHLPMERAVVLAGHPDNEKALNTNVLGLKPNEDIAFTIKHKEDHSDKKLAGKEIQYDLKVISIKQRELPEINDDFARDLGEFDNLKELKTKLKQELLASKNQVREREIAEEVIRKTSDKIAVELPESLVEQEYVSALRRQLSVQEKKGMSEEEIESLKKKAREKAQQTVKNHMILKKIAEKEEIKVTEKDIKERMEAIARANNVPLANVIEHINKEGRREEIEESIQLRKTIDFLAECAIMN